MSSEKAYCFDLDGTVTSEEILPKLAEKLDLFEEIQLLTEATLKGILSFEKSFRLRCKLLSGIPLSLIQEVVSSVALEPDIVNFILMHKKNCFIVTGNLEQWVAPILKRLGCQAYTSSAQYQNNALRINRVLNKADAISMIRQQFSTIIVVGDGMNDVPMFEVADVRIAYHGVHEPASILMTLADYVVTDGKSLCRLLNML